MPEVKSIFLLRHGEVQGAKEGAYYGKSDHILSESGVLQARAAAQRLERVPFQAIYCSPLRRCLQTARLVAGERLPVHPLDGLADLDFGQWEGLSIAEAMKDETAWALWTGGGLDGAPPGGESAAALHERVVLAFEQMLAAYEGSCTLLLVGHHSTLRSIAAYCLGLGAEGARSFRCMPGSLGLIEIVDGIPALCRWNA
ncbi:MAG: histidine phosphatase family protein [Christensenellaceae bacterium]|nr:histidine phosphatase family protein [Christensenellaceae bacterium]